MGMRVIGVDGGEDKAALCTSLGVEAFFDFTQETDIPARVMELTTYGAHGVLVFAATKQAYSSAPAYLRVGGAVIAVGLPKDTSAIAGASPLVVAGKRLRCVKLVDTDDSADGVPGSKALSRARPGRSKKPWISRFEGWCTLF